MGDTTRWPPGRSQDEISQGLQMSFSNRRSEAERTTAHQDLLHSSEAQPPPQVAESRLEHG
jgi:hypothetical protein